MKASELRERSTEDLVELEKILKKELFSSRMKNFTNQLEDTSVLRSKRRDIARIESVLREREIANEQSAAPAAPGGES